MCCQKEKDLPKWISPSHGASDEARTRYLHLGKVALYQMSYTRNNKGYYSAEFENVNSQKEKSRKNLKGNSRPHPTKLSFTGTQTSDQK